MSLRKYYYGLDAVRFFAALLVVFFHLGFWSWASGDATAVAFGGAARYEPLAAFAWFGWVGVEIFFVISGFVIANSANGATSLQFLKGRILRLYPAAWVCATLTLVVLISVLGQPPGDLVYRYVAALALSIKGPWIDGVYWTLAVEIVFYALIFSVLVAGKFSLVHRVAWVLTFYSAAYIAFLVLYRAGSAEALSASVTAERLANLTLLSLARHGCFFAVGMWIWLSSEGRMTRAGWFALAVAALAGMAEIAMRGSELFVYPAAPKWWLLSPVAMWLAVMVLVFVFTHDADRFAPRTARWRNLLRTIGLITYPLYLLHNIAGAVLVRLLIESGMNAWAALGAGIAILLLACFAICRFIEPWLRSGLRGLVDRVEGKRSGATKSARAEAAQ